MTLNVRKILLREGQPQKEKVNAFGGKRNKIKIVVSKFIMGVSQLAVVHREKYPRAYRRLDCCWLI